jgi:hypothetical protein
MSDKEKLRGKLIRLITKDRVDQLNLCEHFSPPGLTDAITSPTGQTCCIWCGAKIDGMIINNKKEEETEK